jgi:hypothetical protein
MIKQHNNKKSELFLEFPALTLNDTIFPVGVLKLTNKLGKGATKSTYIYSITP